MKRFRPILPEPEMDELNRAWRALCADIGKKLRAAVGTIKRFGRGA